MNDLLGLSQTGKAASSNLAIESSNLSAPANSDLMNYYLQYKADLFDGKCGEKDAITFLAGFLASQISRELFGVRH